LSLKGSQGIRIARADCEAALDFLRERNLVVRDLGFLRSCESVIVPVARHPSGDEVKGLASLGIAFECIEADFPAREGRPHNMREYLVGKLPPPLLERIPKSYDIVGDIAILELPEELKGHGESIGEALMKVHGGLRLVLKKTSDISGKFRVGGYEVIAGHGSTETVHREHGCLYRLDPTKVFFTPRLSTERARVAAQVTEGEVVGDLFAGVGPFSILIAKRVAGVKVYSVDVNPIAFQYLEGNIRLNKLGDRVIAILGDAAEVTSGTLKGICSRAIMNLPAGAELFLEAASNALRPEGGVVHLHIFVDGLESLGTRVAAIEDRIREIGWRDVRALRTRVIREVGARSYHVAVDISLSQRE